MKNMIASTLTAVSFAVLLIASTANAQYVQRIIKIDPPFAFTVEGKSLSPGTYSILWIAPNRLEVRDIRGHRVVSLLVHQVESRAKSSETRLKFSTADGGKALTEIWVANDHVGYKLAASKRTPSLARNPSYGSASSGGPGSK